VGKEALHFLQMRFESAGVGVSDEANGAEVDCIVGGLRYGGVV